jgi:hypothetical protein
MGNTLRTLAFLLKVLGIVLAVAVVAAFAAPQAMPAGFDEHLTTCIWAVVVSWVLAWGFARIAGPPPRRVRA